MRHIAVLLSGLLVLSLLTGTIYAQAPDVPPEVEEVAQQGLEMFKGLVGPQAALFGFGSSEQVGQVTLGPGYQLHYLLDGDKLRAASGDSLLDLVTAAPAWLYAVNVDGASKGSLIVALQDGQYRVVDYGGFIEDYGVALTSFHCLISAEGAGTEPTLIKVGVNYYFAARVGTRELVLPAVSSARAKAGFAGGMDYTQLRPASDIVRYLQKEQREAVPGQIGGDGSVDVGATGISDVGQGSTSSSPAPRAWIGAVALLAAAAVGAGALAWRRQTSPKRRTQRG